MAKDRALGIRIRELRRRQGLTQRALCEALELKASTLSQYESGQRTPDDAIKARIADFFGVSLDYLLGRDEFIQPALEKGEPFPVTVMDDSLKNLGVVRFSRLQVQEGAPVEDGQLALVAFKDGRTLVRRLERKNGWVLLIAENGAYETLMVRPRDVEILGRVTHALLPLGREKGKKSER